MLYKTTKFSKIIIVKNVSKILKQLIVPNKNDVIQYKWPKIGQCTFYQLSIKLYTGLLFVICIIWWFFFIRVLQIFTLLLTIVLSSSILKWNKIYLLQLKNRGVIMGGTCLTHQINLVGDWHPIRGGYVGQPSLFLLNAFSQT